MEYTAELGDDTPLEVALFGLARSLPDWVPALWGGDRLILDLGPGTKFIAGVTRLEWPDWDADRDLLSAYPTNSVGGIFCINLLEHLADPRPLILDMGRVLAPGCSATIFVPHATSNMYLQDLDHKTPFVLDTWKNFLDPHPFYEKGHVPGHRLRIGANFVFGVKDENVGIVTQLIKEDA
jgi:SAM-dependent methyltransferase